jgi:hypothetical protein
VYEPSPLYGVVPPFALTLTVEVPPLQRIADAELEVVSNVGSEIETEVEV